MVNESSKFSGLGILEIGLIAGFTALFCIVAIIAILLWLKIMNKRADVSASPYEYYEYDDNEPPTV